MVQVMVLLEEEAEIIRIVPEIIKEEDLEILEDPRITVQGVDNLHMKVEVDMIRDIMTTMTGMYDNDWCFMVVVIFF